MNLIESFSKEAAIALVFGFVTTIFVNQKRKTIAAPALSSHSRSAAVPLLIDAKEAFTGEELSDLTAAWQDDKPEGKFLKARHGTTHYVVNRKGSSSKGMIVLGHGLGSSLKMYKEFSDILVDKGFTVLRYDCFGHGYSKYNGEDMWIKYGPDMYVDQLEDLLDFVCAEEKEEVVAYVGHSNGGVNGISSNFRWSSNDDKNGGSKRSVFPKMILVNPAIYANKPLLARISDSSPQVMISMMRNFPSMKSMIGDNYLELMTKTFGKYDDSNEYRYPEKAKETFEKTLRLFGRVDGVKEHPFIAAAVLGTSCYNIPGGMLPLHREKFSKLLCMSGDNKCDYLFVWGDLDITVPFKENVDDIRNLAKEHSNLRLEELHNLSHEIFVENTASVAEVVLPFLEPN